MSTFECFLTCEERLLLRRDVADKLTLPGGNVRPGESPLEAATHAVQSLTGQHFTPSCAGLYFRLRPGHVTEHGLAFVAGVPPGRAAGADLEWVDFAAITDHPRISPAVRQMIPLVLTADHPLAIVLASDDNAAISEQVVSVSSIDYAVISPLVFASATEEKT